MDQNRLHSRPQDLDPSKRWVIEAAIFQSQPGNPQAQQPQPQLLLQQRSNHETTFPNAWELRGGHIVANDESIRHAVSREVLEKTLLVVSGVVGEIEPMRWESRSGVSNVQLNYVVAVLGEEEVEGEEFCMTGDEGDCSECVPVCCF